MVVDAYCVSLEDWLEMKLYPNICCTSQLFISGNMVDFHKMSHICMSVYVMEIQT